MKKKYTPYGFDEKVEYKIYAKIGERYRRNYLGKKRKNDVDSLEFDKYLEWEKYFIDKFLMSGYNTCNFLHYLNAKFMENQKREESIKVLVIPSYMAMITILLTIIGYPLRDFLVMLIVGIIAIIGGCMYYLIKYRNIINFYKDCIDIINRNTSHQE